MCEAIYALDLKLGDEMIDSECTFWAPYKCAREPVVGDTIEIADIGTAVTEVILSPMRGLAVGITLTLQRDDPATLARDYSIIAGWITGDGADSYGVLISSIMPDPEEVVAQLKKRQAAP